MEKIGNVSLDYLLKRIMKLEKEGKIVNKMFNGTDTFYVAESDIHDTMRSTPDTQIQSTVLTPLLSYDETDSYKTKELKDLQTEMAALNCFFRAVFYNKTKCKVEL